MQVRPRPYRTMPGTTNGPGGRGSGTARGGAASSPPGSRASPGVPGPARPDPPLLTRWLIIETLLVAQGELIDKLQAQVGGLKVALDDEKRQSEQWRRRSGLSARPRPRGAAATAAWKQAVATSRWRGRVEGFAAGVALGYVGASDDGRRWNCCGLCPGAPSPGWPR